MRNNIFYWTTGIQGIYDRTRFKRNNNIYAPIGGCRYPSALAGTLNLNERIITSKIFTDTTATYPENWNLHPIDTSYAYRSGTPILGFTYDFEGHPITTPFIGLYTKLSTVSIDTCRFAYGQWSSCNGVYQTRPYTKTTNGCVGTPPLDSIQRTCSNTIIVSSLYYNNLNKSIFVKSNIGGVLSIYNMLGSLVITSNYTSSGKWVNVSRLPTGVYAARTYRMSVIFIR
jgi:hypothetical protein